MIIMSGFDGSLGGLSIETAYFEVEYSYNRGNDFRGSRLYYLSLFSNQV